MPRKVRELKAMLKAAGFSYRSAKGSHTVWNHPLLSKSVTLSGKDSGDAHRYQEQDVRAALAEVKRLLEDQEDDGE